MSSQYRVSPPAELVSDLCQSRWSYQWGKQKLVCKRTCLTATVVHHVLDRRQWEQEAIGNRKDRPRKEESANIVESRRHREERQQIRTDEGLKKAKSGPDGASRIS
ncbi:uncharacterized protein LOC102677840 [Apis dorsata]|uniref:uncharacterized protein LOC102677840 n=1 Tax=Apis dorsata TaxID=7462 RepID=UPI0012939CB3|nr:uncharacterized protein LOC102677840 [Apis dorsata]